MRIGGTGDLEIIDPTFDDVALLQEIDPAFVVQTAALDGFSAPRAIAGRTIATWGTSPRGLSAMSTDNLWRLHDAGVRTLNELRPIERDGGQASLMDLKVELARRLLSSCRLCARDCGVDRVNGEHGVCDLGPDAIVAEYFVHVGEEAPINPSLVISLAGCGLRCRFCQQGWLLRPDQVQGVPLDERTWSALDPTGARSLSFAGGNPDESLYAILRFLRAMPDDWTLPVVWNTHAYCSVNALRLLDGVVDAYLPDLKYGNAECGRRCSGIERYPDVARDALCMIAAQGVPVIVRILVLPGHELCCHRPSLDSLLELPQERLVVSVRGQYSPDHRIGPNDGLLTRRVSEVEVASVITYARQIGLRVLGNGGE